MADFDRTGHLEGGNPRLRGSGSPGRTRRKSPNFVTARSRVTFTFLKCKPSLLAPVVPLPTRRIA